MKRTYPLPTTWLHFPFQVFLKSLSSIWLWLSVFGGLSGSISEAPRKWWKDMHSGRFIDFSIRWRQSLAHFRYESATRYFYFLFFSCFWHTHTIHCHFVWKKRERDEENNGYIYLFSVAKHLTAFKTRSLDIKKNGSTMAFYNTDNKKKESNLNRKVKNNPGKVCWLFARYFRGVWKPTRAQKSIIKMRPQFPNLALFLLAAKWSLLMPLMNNGIALLVAEQNRKKITGRVMWYILNKKIRKVEKKNSWELGRGQFSEKFKYFIDLCNTQIPYLIQLLSCVPESFLKIG